MRRLLSLSILTGLLATVPLVGSAGEITVIKDCVGLCDGSAQDFSFAASWDGGTTFSLEDGQSSTRTGLAAGPYTISEDALAGYFLVDLTFLSVDGSSSGSVNLPARSATIQLGEEGSVTVRFTNACFEAGCGSVATVPEPGTLALLGLGLGGLAFTRRRRQ